MAQGLLTFDDDEGDPQTVKPAPVQTVKTYRWDWWDAWAPGLSDRDASLLQIQRDLRAYEETGDDFYLGRVELHRDALKRSGDGE